MHTHKRDQAYPSRIIDHMGIRKRGFTLIELLVVIAIIGILASIVMASLSNARKRGRDGRRLSDLKQIQLALELYYDANKQFPTALSALPGPGYIPTLPNDPGSNNPYAYVALVGPSLSAAECGSYHLGAKLEVYTAETFSNDYDAATGGAYGTSNQDGTLCTGSTYNPGASYDIAPVAVGAGNDFDGQNDSTDLVYDVRP